MKKILLFSIIITLFAGAAWAGDENKTDLPESEITEAHRDWALYDWLQDQFGEKRKHLVPVPKSERPPCWIDGKINILCYSSWISLPSRPGKESDATIYDKKTDLPDCRTEKKVFDLWAGYNGYTKKNITSAQAIEKVIKDYHEWDIDLLWWDKEDEPYNVVHGRAGIIILKRQNCKEDSK